MTLQDIADALQQRLDFMAKMDDFEWSEWIGCYNALIACKQAQASEKQNELLLRIAIGVECLENLK